MISQNNIAIFASGTGSNAKRLIEFALKNNLPLTHLICDNPKAEILKEPLPIHKILITANNDKNEYENRLINFLKDHKIKKVFLAGYMRLLSKNFINEFYSYVGNEKAIINIHPSLLPKYPGLNSYERFYKSEEPFSGISIHYVDAGMDTGELILQAKLERKNNENLEDFIERGKTLEHQLYPKVMLQLCQGLKNV
jgi:phosphoribosylglycinamide formyltransferase-1